VRKSIIFPDSAGEDVQSVNLARAKRTGSFGNAQIRLDLTARGFIGAYYNGFTD
jgi:hypothetical protein